MFSLPQLIRYFDLLDYLHISSCYPFKQTIKLFERSLFYIPPLSKLNLLYEQLVGIRFCSLTYLAYEGNEI